jgi:hypothetical protein
LFHLPEKIVESRHILVLNLLGGMGKANCGTLVNAHSRPSGLVIAKFIDPERGAEEVGLQSLKGN